MDTAVVSVSVLFRVPCARCTWRGDTRTRRTREWIIRYGIAEHELDLLVPNPIISCRLLSSIIISSFTKIFNKKLHCHFLVQKKGNPNFFDSGSGIRSEICKRLLRIWYWFFSMAYSVSVSGAPRRSNEFSNACSLHNSFLVTLTHIKTFKVVYISWFMHIGIFLGQQMSFMSLSTQAILIVQITYDTSTLFMYPQNMKKTRYWRFNFNMFKRKKQPFLP